nr:hypothetical protein [Lujinxingia litoralis]
MGQVEAVGEEFPGVGVGFEAILGEQGGAADPEVGVVEPAVEGGPGLVGMVVKDGADEVGGDLVGEVPPGAVSDEAFVEGEGGGGDEGFEASGEADGDVFFFAVGELPESFDEGDVVVVVGEVDVGGECFDDLVAGAGLDAVKGHGCFHVRRHLLGVIGVGECLEVLGDAAGDGGGVEGHRRCGEGDCGEGRRWRNGVRWLSASGGGGRGMLSLPPFHEYDPCR